MKAFCIFVALLAKSTLAAPGASEGPSPLDNLLDYKNPDIAPTRFDYTMNVLTAKETTSNTDPGDNNIDMKVWLKANDMDRKIQEFHGKVILNLKTKPVANETISLGFYFGVHSESEGSSKADRNYEPPSTWDGSYATFGF